MTLNDLALKTSGNLVEKQGMDKVVAFDPTLIMVIIEIIRMAISALGNCGNDTPEKATSIAKNPNYFQRFLLRRYIERATRKPALTRKLESAILAEGGELTVEQVKALLEDAD